MKNNSDDWVGVRTLWLNAPTHWPIPVGVELKQGSELHQERLTGTMMIVLQNALQICALATNWHLASIYKLTTYSLFRNFDNDELSSA